MAKIKKPSAASMENIYSLDGCTIMMFGNIVISGLADEMSPYFRLSKRPKGLAVCAMQGASPFVLP